MLMSGEEVIFILNEELEDLIGSLAEGIDGSYDEIKRIIREDDNPDEMRDSLKELVLMMADSGRISREQADMIIGRLDE